MNKTKGLVAAMESIDNKGLTDVTTPKELLKWLNDNITYHGVVKDRVWTPKEVIKNGKGHCWETSELERVYLQKMGFKCKLLYLETKNQTVTHTTVFYEDNNKWYWFEWAWGEYEGIHGPYTDTKEAINIVVNNFNKKYGKAIIIKLGNNALKENGTYKDYMEMVDSWATPKIDEKK